MSGRVIQGFFLGGQPRVAAGVAAPPKPNSAAQAKAGPHIPAPPPTAFAPPASAAQRKAAPAGPPKPAFAPKQAAVAQLFGGNDAFAVDPARLGLSSGGGRTLPDAVRGKMEAAFGADFSAVRVHVGPQAERVGAIAFTLGQDIYFAPGRFQPDTVQGQQLLGHELAHVVQQRQGRVRNPLGSGVAVVQDRALEAEADRLGMRAAAQAGASPTLQRKATQTVRISAPVRTAPGSVRLTAGAGGNPLEAPASRLLTQAAQAKMLTGFTKENVLHSQVIQSAKKKEEDDEGDYIPPQGKKQKRFTFSASTTESVIRGTAHERLHVNLKHHNAVYTCPGCRRPLAYVNKAGKLKLTRRDYTSKSGKLHKQRALSVDHYPPWAPRERDLKSRGASEAEIRKEHDDTTKLRALCSVCNVSHKFETKKKVEYESDTDEEGYETPDDEQENKGFYKPFRDPPPPPPPGAVA